MQESQENSTQEVRVGAAVISYSRQEELKQLVDALRNQTRPPDEIIVVFQGNNEEIWDWLTTQDGIRIFRQENSGTAGGFVSCLERSIELDCDWTWIFDDDGLPSLNALEELLYSGKHLDDRTGFISSRVVDATGKSYMNPTPRDHNQWFDKVLQERWVFVSASAGLGMMISSAAVKKIGFPIAEYFLWDVDAEFSQRLARAYNCYCALGSVVSHQQEPTFDPINRASDKLKYLTWVRNRFHTIRQQKRGTVRTFLSQARFFAEISKKILKREAPLSCLRYMIVGWTVFRPKVRFPAS